MELAMQGVRVISVETPCGPVPGTSLRWVPKCWKNSPFSKTEFGIFQGKCDPSHEDFEEFIDKCPYTCTDGECQPAGNEQCQDTSLYCPQEEFIVRLHTHDVCSRTLPTIGLFLQGNCNVTSDVYFPTIRDCHYTCTGGKCNGKEGNDVCSDSWWSCPKYKYQVNVKPTLYLYYPKSLWRIMLFFSSQGRCDPSHEKFESTLDNCPFTCTNGECPTPAGNEQCQDSDIYCPREKFLVPIQN